MAYFSTEPASQRRNINGKKRVWDFFPLSSKTHPANRRQPAQPRREIDPTATKAASGIPCWPSRDPIEEGGEANLYGFVGNDGVGNIDLIGLNPGQIYTNKYEAFRDAWHDVATATSKSVDLGLKEVEELKKLDTAIKQGQTMWRSGTNSFLYSRRLPRINHKDNQDKSIFLRDYVVGVEYATIVYCIKSSGNYSYRELIRGEMPTENEYRENASWGGVSVAVLLAASEQLKIEARNPLAVVHAHNMKAFTEYDGRTVEKQTELELSGSDNDFTKETGIVVCAVTEGRWVCNGGQPK